MCTTWWRGKSLASTMSQYLISRIESSSRITLHTESEIVGLEGATSLESVTWMNRRDGGVEDEADSKRVCDDWRGAELGVAVWRGAAG